MRITLVQDDIVWADKTANLQKTAKHLDSLAGTTDLVVLPEMFTTGFCIDPTSVAETMEGETVSTLKAWALHYQFAIAGSFIATEGGKFFNRAFFVFPNRSIEFADKRHLFSKGGEDKYFTAGGCRIIVHYCSFRICVLICYDIRFPVWSRNNNNEYDLLVYVANFPQSRIAEWDILLRARAIENQSYVCGVNRIGADHTTTQYNGHSALLHWKGIPLLSFPDNTATTQTATLDLQSLKHYRNEFAVWKDADSFKIL